MDRRRADVGQYAQPAVAIAEDILHRLPRVVRDRKGKDLEIANGEGGVTIDHDGLHPTTGEGRGRGDERAVGEMDRDAIAAGETRDAADVIVMLVSDDDGGQALGLDAKPREAADRIVESEAAVEHDPRAAVFDDERVAAAAAAEGREPQCDTRSSGGDKAGTGGAAARGRAIATSIAHRVAPRSGRRIRNARRDRPFPAR